MCGIVATFGGKPIDKALELYENQKGRGYKGFGFIALKHGKRIAFERAASERDIKKALEDVARAQPDTILFHHRFPTSTINVPEAAHPLPISKKGWAHRYYMLHNGVVNGGSENDIVKAGYRFKSRVSEIKYYKAGKNTYTQVIDSEVNDSEILGYYVASYLEGERKDIPMSGAIAAIVLREHKKTGVCTLYAMRNTGNPLCVQRKKGTHTLSIASEGEGADLSAGTVHELDWKSLTFKTHATLDIGTYASYTGYHGGAWTWDKDTVVPMPPTASYMGYDTKADTAIIKSESERLSRLSVEAHGAYQDALVEFADDTSIDALEYIEELKDKAEAAEDNYQEANEGQHVADFTI